MPKPTFELDVRAVSASLSMASEFEEAQVRVKAFKSTPSPGELLELYALYKQGTAGDVTGARPGILDIKGRAKFDAWEKKKGQAKDGAQSAYVALVNELGKRYA